MSALRILLVGSGYAASHHAGGWLAVADYAELVGIASPDEGAARALAQRHGAQGVWPSLEAALSEARFDIVDICAPLAVHGRLVRQAAAAGCHIMCQKPLDISLEAAIETALAAQQAGVRLMVHENYRFRPWIRSIEAQLRGGAVGRLLVPESDQ